MDNKNNEQIERLIVLSKEIYNKTKNTEAIMYLAYAWGMAEANKLKNAS